MGNTCPGKTCSYSTAADKQACCQNTCANDNGATTSASAMTTACGTGYVAVTDMTVKCAGFDCKVAAGEADRSTCCTKKQTCKQWYATTLATDIAGSASAGKYVYNSANADTHCSGAKCTLAADKDCLL